MDQSFLFFCKLKFHIQAKIKQLYNGGCHGWTNNKHDLLKIQVAQSVY